jgi:hypothetical protein
MYQQAVVRLCQGAADKEAGSYASNIQEFLRSLAGIIELDLGCFGEFSKAKRFSSFRMRSMYAISWLRSTKRA